MTVMILCILSMLLNLGGALYGKMNYDKHMREWRALGRMEGFIDGVKASHEGKAVVKGNILVMN